MACLEFRGDRLDVASRQEARSRVEFLKRSFNETHQVVAQDVSVLFQCHQHDASLRGEMESAASAGYSVRGPGGPSGSAVARIRRTMLAMTTASSGVLKTSMPAAAIV
jgi:hypothetical protein